MTEINRKVKCSDCNSDVNTLSAIYTEPNYFCNNLCRVLFEKKLTSGMIPQTKQEKKQMKLIAFISSVLGVFSSANSTKPKAIKQIQIANNASMQSLNSNSSDSNVDTAVGFGYKITWFAVKTNNQEAVAQSLGLSDLKRSSWKDGIENAYKDKVYITPQIKGWTLAVGAILPSGDTKESYDTIAELLNKLSKKFGEAQFFCTHRIVEYHCWIKSTHGRIIRAYSYIGESDENIVVQGEPTSFEKKYKLINTLSKAAQKDEYYDQEDLVYPNEQLVMSIANNWSVDPTKLDGRTDIKGSGLLGR